MKKQEVLLDDPVEVGKYDKAGLVELWANTRRFLEEIRNQEGVIRDTLEGLIEGDGEIIGDYSVTKRTRISFGSTTIKQARDLGAIKEGKDTKALRRLHDGGVEVPGVKVTNYIMVREVSKE